MSRVFNTHFIFMHVDGRSRRMPSRQRGGAKADIAAVQPSRDALAPCNQPHKQLQVALKEPCGSGKMSHTPTATASTSTPCPTGTAAPPRASPDALSPGASGDAGPGSEPPVTHPPADFVGFQDDWKCCAQWRGAGGKPVTLQSTKKHERHERCGNHSKAMSMKSLPCQYCATPLSTRHDHGENLNATICVKTNTRCNYQ